MKVKEKKVYYCDHCKKHGLSRPAMEKHESTCTMNPYRRCRWKSADGGEHGMAWTLSTLVARLRQQEGRYVEAAEIEKLRGEVSGCPACMLAALRQCGRDYHTVAHWDFEAEVESFRKAEREEWDYEAVY